MRSIKQDVESLLNRLPDDVSVEDISIISRFLMCTGDWRMPA